MLYEATTNSAYPAKNRPDHLLVSEDIQGTTAATGKEPTPRAAAMTESRSAKDLKVESKNKICFPFMPDLVDYVCENIAIAEGERNLLPAGPTSRDGIQMRRMQRIVLSARRASSRTTERNTDAFRTV